MAIKFEVCRTKILGRVVNGYWFSLFVTLCSFYCASPQSTFEMSSLD